MGTFYNFIEDKEVRLIGCEAAGRGKRGGDDLAVQAKGGDDIFKREMDVGKKRYMRNGEIGSKVLLQLLMFSTHIGEKTGIPERTDLLAVFLKIRHGRAGNIDYVVHKQPPADGKNQRGKRARLLTAKMNNRIRTDIVRRHIAEGQEHSNRERIHIYTAGEYIIQSAMPVNERKRAGCNKFCNVRHKNAGKQEEERHR